MCVYVNACVCETKNIIKFEWIWYYNPASAPLLHRRIIALTCVCDLNRHGVSAIFMGLVTVALLWCTEKQTVLKLLMTVGCQRRVNDNCRGHFDVLKNRWC